MTPDQVWNIIYLLIIKLIKWSFSKEAFASILVLISSLATLILTNRNNNKQNEEQRKFQIQQSELQRKENFINISLENRIEAYSQLFDQLKEFKAYFELFVAKQDEFKESKDENEFAPLEEIDRLRNVYNQKLLWLSKDAQKAFLELFSLGKKGCDLAINIAIDKLRETESEDELFVEGYCIDMLEKTDEVNKIIREDLGLTYIEEYKERLRKVNF
ncbi:hypothetical protein [Priestia megaterium]|uniref:hypothetical protein n=1 Tax=Priestia megaterium TaxID=1404 RepID=UPI002E208715|nr:hypothetical protein [Priestia megaterium]